MAVPATPKGTRDFYPEEMAILEHIFSSWHRTCRKYAFELYDGPTFEHIEIYTQKSGAEIEKQLYSFEDKGGRMMALRPEMTPTLARMVAAKGNNLKRPIRWYSIPRLFRYEKMQRGRLREFFQLNMDILGIEEVTADAELIAAAIEMMQDLGLTEKDFKVRISSRKLLEECFLAFSLSQEEIKPLYALLDRKGKISPEEYEEELRTLIREEIKREKINNLFNVKELKEIENIIGSTSELSNLKRLFELIDKYGKSQYVCFDIGIVRGLAYYTGIVFEIFALDKNLRAIAGGGRYDNLVELYGGPHTPAVGFAAGDVVLSEILKEKGMLPSPPARCNVFIAAFDEDGYQNIIPLTQQIRREGISCEFPLKVVNISRQLKLADASGAKFTVFCGGIEGREGKVKIKNMIDGSEITIQHDELITYLKLNLT